MRQYIRPDQQIFASAAKPGELAVFPDITRGWGVAFDQSGGIPPMEWFNALFQRNDEAIHYLLQRGIAEWAADEQYPVAAYVQHNHKVWQAIEANHNQPPKALSAYWVEAALTRDEISTVVQNLLTDSPLFLRKEQNLNDLLDKPLAVKNLGAAPLVHNHSWQQLTGSLPPHLAALARITSIQQDTQLTAEQMGLVLLDANEQALTLTLPAANVELGVIDIIVRRVDNSNHRLVVQCAGQDRIQFHTHLNIQGYPFMVLMGAGDYWHLRSDGTGRWWPLERLDSTPLGRTVFDTALFVAPGGYGSLNGMELPRAEWPWLWDFAQRSELLIAEEQRPGMEGGWSKGDGVSTFCLPDGRGEFLRMLDEGRGIDAERLAGSWQPDEFKQHSHSCYDTAWPGIDGFAGNARNRVKTSTGETGGGETRPRNIAYPGRIKLI